MQRLAPSQRGRMKAAAAALAFAALLFVSTSLLRSPRTRDAPSIDTCSPLGPTRRCPTEVPAALRQKELESLTDDELAHLFSEGGAVAVRKVMPGRNKNAAVANVAPRQHYGEEFIQGVLTRIEKRQSVHWGYAEDVVLYDVVKDFPDAFRGKRVVIPGSELPHYEVFLQRFAGAASTETLEYRMFSVSEPKIHVRLVETYWREVAAAPGSPDHVFDTVFSYSNFEHDGLGRYGDPLDPDGDRKAVKEMWSMLRPGGHLILALPVGADCVAFYGNRRYGPLRLGWLLQGFRLRKFYATASPDYHPGPTDPCTAMPQWVFVLERANSVDANPLYSLRAQLPEQFWTLKPLHP